MKTDYEITLSLLERLSRIINNDAAVSSLKPAQWEALRYLGKANRFSRTPSALTAYMGVTKGSVSQTINALERKELIEKATVIGDKRSVTIVLSPSGEEMLEEDPLQIFSKAIEQLPHHEAAKLNDLLESLLKTALIQRSSAPFGVCVTCRHFKKNAPEGNPHQCSLLQEPLSVSDSEMICREHTN
jgi:DNA-binding MarR family transcriptional regulator